MKRPTKPRSKPLLGMYNKTDTIPSKREIKSAREEFKTKPIIAVEIPLPCQCQEYPFAHYHADSPSMRAYDLAVEGYLRGKQL